MSVKRNKEKLTVSRRKAKILTASRKCLRPITIDGIGDFIVFSFLYSNSKISESAGSQGISYPTSILNRDVHDQARGVPSHPVPDVLPRTTAELKLA